MANWVILTGDNIRLLDTEVTIMQNITPLQDLDSCVLSAQNYCRGYLAGGGNILEPAPAIPPEVVDDAIAIARATYLAQEPTGTLLTEIRREERDNAIAHLRDIAKDLSTITQGDVPPTSELFGKWGSFQKLDMRTEDDWGSTTTPP
jgi:hypothetical protein